MPASPDNSQGSVINKIYSVSSAAKTAGVSPKQLYYWEHLGIVKPLYEEFGTYSYRRYSQEQIKFLTKIKDLLNSGYTLQAAFKKARENGSENGNDTDHE
jgi:DNA-binding transcriptional MerR regulator